MGRHPAATTLHGSGVLHRLPAQAKVVGLLCFVLAVVAVPRTGGMPWWPVLGVDLAIAATLLALTRAPATVLARRLSVELPFLVFALVLPFIASGPRMPLGPVTVSQPGLHAAGVLAATVTCGVMAGVAFSVTTTGADLVRGLSALRLPTRLVEILAFMVRYAGVVGGELARMKVARESRGFRPRSPRAWGVLASAVGALFLRSYERGERVHLAMLSRGYTGDPAAATAWGEHTASGVTRSAWAMALVPAMLAGTALTVGHLA